MNIVVSKEDFEMALQDQNITKLLKMIEIPRCCSRCEYYSSHRPTYAGTCTKLAINPDNPTRNGCTDWTERK